MGGSCMRAAFFKTENGERKRYIASFKSSVLFGAPGAKK